jgi:hypothetical protein
VLKGEKHLIAETARPMKLAEMLNEVKHEKKASL